MEKRIESTLMLANLTSRVFRQLMRLKTEEAGLNETYRPFIMILSRGDGINQLEFSKRLHFSAPSISLTLQKMEQEGFIKREQDEADKRNTIVSLTDKGKEYDNRFKSVLFKVEDEIFEGIPLSEREQANELLLKLIKKITEVGDMPHEDI